MRHLQIILLFVLTLLLSGVSPAPAQNSPLFTSENAPAAEGPAAPGPKITFTTGMKKLVFSVAGVTLVFMVLLLVL